MTDLRKALEQPTYEFECPRCGHCCQQREWVGLTDEDKEGIKNKATYNWDTTAGEYASEVQALTEAKLKEKNT